MDGLMFGNLFLAAGALSPGDITVLLLGLAVLLGAAKIFGELASRLHQPAILGEIIAGIFLGPTVLGALMPEPMRSLFPEAGAARVGLEAFVTVAVTLLLLVAGLEVNLSRVIRRGKTALCVSLTGISIAFTSGFLISWFSPGLLGMAEDADPLVFALFIGIALSITALPVIAKTLIDLNIMKSDMGMVVVSAAMVDDLLGWIGFAMVIALMGGIGEASPGGAGPHEVLMTMAMTFGYIILMLTVGRVVIHRTLPYVQAHMSWPGGVLGMVCVIALLGAAYTEWAGVHAIFGAFIAGIAIGDSDHLRERTRETIHQFITNIFAPVFFASIGLRISFIENFDLVLVLLVTFIAVVTKVTGCRLGARLAGLPRRESLAVGFGMVGRGAMEIILAGIAFDLGLITERLFVAIVIMALVTSLLSGPMMQRILRRKQRKRLASILSDKQFVPELESTNRRAVLAKLSEQASVVTGLEAELIERVVWEREERMSTGLENGIAVPHARLAGLDKPLMVIGRSMQGVDFDASDGEPARIICLLLTPQQDAYAQIEMLDMVVRAFGDDEARADALSAKSYVELLAAINRAEQRMATHNEH